MVRAAQKGEAKATSPEVARTAASIKMKDAKKFASTKHKGLPEKKMKKESVSEDAKMARQSDDKLSAAHKKFSGMEQTPANSFMKKRIEREINRRKKGIGAKNEEKSYYIDKEAEKRGRERDARKAQNKAAAKERAAQKRRTERNNLRRQGKYGAVGGHYVTKHMEREGVETHPMSLGIITEKKKGMVKIKVNRPIKVKVTDIGAGGKEYVRKNWEQTTVTNDGSKLSPLHVPGGPNSQFNVDGTKKVLKKTLNKVRGTAFKTEDIKMSRKAYKKLHKDFKSDDPKNPRTTKYEPGKGTVSHRVKFTDEYVPEGANPYGKRAKIKMIIKGFSEKNRSKAGSVKEDAIDENIVKDVISNVKKVGGKVKDKIKDVMNRPIMAPTINKQQHLQKIRNSGGNPSHWESAQNEGALATGAALTAAGLAAWKFSKGMQTRNKMKKAIDTPGTNLNSIKNATDQKNKMLQQLNQSYVPPGMEISEKKKGMIKIKVNKPIKAKVTDIGAGGKEYVRKNWEQTTVTNDGSPLSPRHSAGGDLSQFNSDGTKKVLKKTLNKIRGTAFKTEGTSYGMYKGDGKPKGPMAKFGKKKKKEKKIEEKVNLKDKSSQYARSTKEVDTAMTDHVNRKRGTHYGKDGKVTEVGRYRRQSKREARNELISMNKESKSFSQFQQECWKTHKKVGMKMKGGKLVPDCRPKNEEVEIIDEKKSPAWQRKAGKSESGGLNAKGVASY